MLASGSRIEIQFILTRDVDVANRGEGLKNHQPTCPNMAMEDAHG